jgi:hypothetical protein
LYTLQLIDDYSHEQWTILLKRKSDAAQQVKEWITIVEAESGEKVGIFRVDLGTEFDKAGFIRYLRDMEFRRRPLRRIHLCKWGSSSVHITL